MGTQSNSQTTLQFNYAHLLEWIRDSGVDHKITERSIISLFDRKVVAKKLGWKKYPDNFPLGWWASGLDLTTMKPQEFGQFKPDEKILINGKEVKYITDKGHPYDAIALPHPDPEYWQRVLDDVSIPVDVDEGTKKSGAGMTCGFPSLALCGVTLWQFKGELVSNLAAVAVPGRTIRIRFDMDLLFKEGVLCEVKKLAKALRKKGCNVLVAMWDKGLGLKIDDVLVNHGEETVKKIMADAIPYAQWLKNLEVQVSDIGESRDTGTSKKGKQIPPPSKIAREIAENYREKLAWESEYQLWRQYAAEHDGCWGIATEESVRELIHCHVEVLGIDYNAGYISSILIILKSKLEAKKWNEQAGLIPLRDGVLDQLTQELKPHAPGYRFTWQLPFKWADRSVGCEPIEKFLLRITGNQAIANVLLAFLNCIVTRQSKQQRYLELKGGGGTGKSTYMGLARALAGEDNTVSSQLKHLENNQFETAKFYGKLLALFPDSERWQGEVSVLKQMTGQDPVRYERKGVQQCRDFIFGGMVILSANEAPESRDLTSGQERRKLTIELDIKVPEYEDAELIEQFKPFLPGLLKRVLDMPREEVTRLIKHTDKEVPELAQVKWKQLCETNPIAGWLDEKAIIDPDAKGYIGLGDIEEAGRWLYANFCKHQQDNGVKNCIPMKRFSNNLRDLLKNQMKVAIAEGRDRNGSFIQGIGLRCHIDPTGELYPCPVTRKPFCDGFVMDCDRSVTVESLTDVGFDGYYGFSQNLEDAEKSQPESSSTPSPDKSCGVDGEGKTSHPSNPTPASVPTVTNPAQERKNPSHPETFANKHHAHTLAEKMREALASHNADAVRDIWEEVNNSYPRQVRGFFPKNLTPEEINAVNLLLNYGFIKGVQVKYVGTDTTLKEQYGDMVLRFYSNNDHKIPLVNCLMSDGTSLTTWLSPKDLHKL
jgi:putative DNA primase/helicase